MVPKLGNNFFFKSIFIIFVITIFLGYIFLHILGIFLYITFRLGYTDKTPKKHYWGRVAIDPLPSPPLAALVG